MYAQVPKESQGWEHRWQRSQGNGKRVPREHLLGEFQWGPRWCVQRLAVFPGLLYPKSAVCGNCPHCLAQATDLSVTKSNIWENDLSCRDVFCTRLVHGVGGHADRHVAILHEIWAWLRKSKVWRNPTWERPRPRQYSRKQTHLFNVFYQLIKKPELVKPSHFIISCPVPSKVILLIELSESSDHTVGFFLLFLFSSFFAIKIKSHHFLFLFLHFSFFPCVPWLSFKSVNFFKFHI